MKKKKTTPKPKKTVKDFNKYAGILKGDVMNELMKEKRIEKKIEKKL